MSLREWLVAGMGGLTLAFSAWGLGGIPAWSLHVLFSGGLLTFLVAIIPFPEKGRRAGNVAERGIRFDPHKKPEVQSTSSISDQSANSATATTPHIQRRASSISSPKGASSTSGAKRLLKWPFFWFSLCFLLYLLVGALNPAAEVLRNESGWWVQAIQSRWSVWLPTSVRSDYQPMNAWRVLESFTASFCLVWGLWAGLNRRKPVLVVIWCLLLSGAGMGLVGMLQHLTEAEGVLWKFPSSNDYFWGSFFYRNQGAAYLNLILVAAAFLFFYHAVKTLQRARSSGPHFLCFFLFFGTATSIGLALSRGGILFASILSFVFLALLLIYGIQVIFHSRSFFLPLLSLLVLAGGTYSTITYIDLEAIEKRFGDIGATIENADQDLRALSTRATWDMAQGRLLQGWGAGSFRYIFPMYQRNYPELFYGYYDKRKQLWVGRKMYRYAHNDIMQFVAEYGLIGSGFIFGGIAVLLLQAVYHSREQTFAALILVAGAGQAFGHAFLDFIFNSPAYWIAFLGLLVASTKLLHLERARSGALELGIRS